MEGFWLFKTNEVAFGCVIGTFSAIEVSGDKFLSKEVRNFSLGRFCIVVYLQCTCYNKSGMLVEEDVAFHTY